MRPVLHEQLCRPIRRVSFNRVCEQEAVLVDDAPNRILELLDALEARVLEESPVEYAEEDVGFVYTKRAGKGRRIVSCETCR